MKCLQSHWCNSLLPAHALQYIHSVFHKNHNHSKHPQMHNSLTITSQPSSMKWCHQWSNANEAIVCEINAPLRPQQTWPWIFQKGSQDITHQNWTQNRRIIWKWPTFALASRSCHWYVSSMEAGTSSPLPWHSCLSAYLCPLQSPSPWQTVKLRTKRNGSISVRLGYTTISSNSNRAEAIQAFLNELLRFVTEVKRNACAFYIQWQHPLCPSLGGGGVLANHRRSKTLTS